MKYPYDMARRLREMNLAIGYEAAGTIEFMAELITQPQRDPPTTEAVPDFPFKSNFEKFSEEMASPERRCKCGAFQMGNASQIKSMSETHRTSLCWKDLS